MNKKRIKTRLNEVQFHFGGSVVNHLTSAKVEIKVKVKGKTKVEVNGNGNGFSTSKPYHVLGMPLSHVST